jgi:two-component sensor histidine kinase
MDQQTAIAHSSRSDDVGDPWIMLIGAVEKLSAARDHDEVARIVVEAARRLSGADGSWFMLREGDLCHCVDEDAIAPIWKGSRLPVSGCIAGWCMLHGETASIPDVAQDERISHAMRHTTHVGSLVTVPVGRADPTAAIGVYWARQQVADAAAVTILEALARTAATALASATRHEALTNRVDELAALYRLTDKLYRAESLADTCDAALDAIFSTFSCNRASILLFDESGVMRFVAWRGLSDQYRKAVEGHSPWKPGDRDPEPIFVTDIDATDEPKPLKAVIRGEGIRGLAFIPLVSKGTVVGKFMIYYPSPHTFVDHEVDLAVTIARQLGFSIERLHAEQELRRSEDLVRLATRTGKVGLWEWDIRLDRVSWTDSLYSIHQVDKQTFNATVEGFAALVHPKDRERVSRAIERALREDVPYELEFRAVRPDGQVIWLFTNAIVLRDGDGPVRMVGATFDITDRKHAEAQRELLLAELNHRVKNTLAVVQGIAHQTFKRTDASPEARRAFEGRLAALAAAHNLLTRASWEQASLEHLTAEALQVRAVNEQRLSFSGPRVHLQPKQALAIAIALHELCTNAMKYGALSNETGSVAFEWHRTDGSPPRLTMVWREQGGPVVSPPARRGFGSRMIERALAQDLKGDVTMDFRPGGLVCTIDAPLPERRGH